MCDTSQSSDWAFTPPDSPGSNNGNSSISQNEAEYVPACFHCLGHASKKDHEFHPSGFLKSECLNRNFTISDETNTYVKLFSKTYNFWSALQDNGDLLFNLCRQSFMQLDSRRNENFNSLGLPHTSNSESVSSVQLRSDVYLFFNYLSVFMKSSLLFYEKSKMLETLLPMIESNFKRLRLLFQRLSFAYLPDYVLAYYSSAQGNKSSNPIYNLIHCHLDVRWLSLKIIDNIKKAKINEEESSSFSQTNSNAGDMTFDDDILMLMSELIWLSIVKFEKTEIGDVMTASTFTCTCVKELWLLLIKIVGREDFWGYFNQILHVALRKISPPENFVPNCSKFHVPEYFPCSNREQFSLWMLSNVAKLYEYDEDGFHVGKTDRVKANFEMFDDIVKTFISSDPPEAALRSYLPLIQSVLRLWGHEKSDSVIVLWEYYHKKLNAAFYILGNKLDSMAVSSNTASGLLEQVKSRLNPNQQRDRNENSYSLFLQLLGVHLRYCHAKKLPSQKLLGRIFIKFPPTKVEKLLELNEFGLYHLSSLYLTLAVVTEAEPTIKKLHSLMTVLPRDKLSPAQRTTVRKSLAACLLLLAEENGSLDEMADVILKEVRQSLLHQDIQDVRIFMDCLRVIFESGNPHVSLLVDDWIGMYLNLCSHSDASWLLSMFSQLIDKLRSGKTSWSDEHSQRLQEKIVKFVLPALNTTPTIAMADLAANFSLLFLQGGSNVSDLTNLYQQWINRDDVKLAARYLSMVLSDFCNSELLKNNFPNYQSDVLQCWIKCHIMARKSSETQDLTKIVLTLPRIAELCNGRRLKDCDDYFSAIISLFSVAYSIAMLNERTHLKGRFVWIFNHMDKFVQSEMQNLDKIRKEINIDDLYRYSGEIAEKCYNLAYTKSNPKSLLKTFIDHLLLPQSIFKPEFVLPPSVYSAIFKYLPLFVRGLLELGPSTDIFISRTLREIVTQYHPRLSKSLGSELQRHPLYLCLLEEKGTAFIAEMLASHFLTVKGKTPHSNAFHAIRLFSEASLGVAGQVILKTVMSSVLNVLILSDGHHSAREEAFKFLKIVFREEENRKSFLPALKMSCEKHLPFSSALWFSMASQLANILPDEMRHFIPTIESEIQKVEKRRGVERDQGLRNNLEKFRLSLERTQVRGR